YGIKWNFMQFQHSSKLAFLPGIKRFYRTFNPVTYRMLRVRMPGKTPGNFRYKIRYKIIVLPEFPLVNGGGADLHGCYERFRGLLSTIVCHEQQRMVPCPIEHGRWYDTRPAPGFAVSVQFHPGVFPLTCFFDPFGDDDHRNLFGFF